MAASLVSMVMSAKSLVFLIALLVNVFREQDIVSVNASLDSMAAIATFPVLQTVIFLSVIRLQVTVVVDVLVVFMVTNAHKFAQRIVRTFVIRKKAPVTHAKWVIMEINV